jgi:hypothetical protein
MLEKEKGRRSDPIPNAVCQDRKEFNPFNALAQSVFRRSYVVERRAITAPCCLTHSRSIRAWRASR